MGPALAVLLFVVAPAAATTPEEQANRLYQQGKELMAAGELEAAVERFSAAWKAFQHPLIVKKRAEAREKLVLYEEAVADYRIYLARLKPRKKKERRVILERIAALEALLRKPVAVTVVSSRPGVTVSVDSAPAKRTPFELMLAVGKHSAELTDPRFVSTKKPFRVRPGKPQVVRIQAVPRTGTVIIATDRDDFTEHTIALNRKPITLVDSERPSQRLSGRELVIGSHSLVCSLPGLPNFYREFDVVEGQATTVTCRFAELTGPSVIGDAWGWVTVAGAVAGLAAGTGLFVSWAADVQKAEDENLELITDKHIWGGVALGAGVGLAIGSYFVFTRNRGAGSAAAPPALTPRFVVLPGGGVAGAQLRF